MKEASYYTILSENKVRCLLCPHRCIIRENEHGFCLTRENIGGTLMAANYLRPVSVATDPIEKKPLYHFHPGSEILSMGPNGCTFQCSFCQNHEISQQIHSLHSITLDDLTAMVLKSKSVGIAYTYSEPYIWFETIMTAAPRIKENGKVNVMVTNGFMEPAPLAELVRVIDAMNIDIKSMNPDFYRKLCKGELAPVLRTCETVKKHCHLEITALLITGENDSPAEIKQLADFIATNLGIDTPLHLSRCFPRYKLTVPPTPYSVLLDAWEIARTRLNYVYLGNIDAGKKSDTYCPVCSALLIQRNGYVVSRNVALTKSDTGQALCGACGKIIPIVD